MKNFVNLLFEARKLKHIPRSGYQFLENGKESVAEHSFITAFVAYVMAHMVTEGIESDSGRKMDQDKLVRMCLIHDLAEARIGDLNHVQKKYVKADERQAIEDALKDLPFGPEIMDLLNEFREGKSLEAQLAKDADQLAFLLDLKAMQDRGRRTLGKWIRNLSGRLKTQTGKNLFQDIMQTDSDAWWIRDHPDKNVDTPVKKN